MDELYDPTRPTLERIMEGCERSAADLAAGRVKPIEPFLREMRERALRRIEAREQAARDVIEKSADAAE